MAGGTALWTGHPGFGVAVVVAVTLHEGAHALTAALLGRPARLRLQLGSGAAYLQTDRRLDGTDTAVLLAGSGLGGPAGWCLGFGLFHGVSGPYLPGFGAALMDVSVGWSLYQISPLPVTDGGVLLRERLEPRWGAVRAWQATWVLGGLYAALWVAGSPRLLEPCIWLLGLAVVLGRSEMGYVRRVEAFQALQRGQPQAALRRALEAPKSLPKHERHALARLGVYAGLQIEDAEGVEQLIVDVPAAAPEGLDAITWLLRLDRDSGGPAAERVHDSVDGERAGAFDRERYADMSFYHAIFEARRLRPESALGLLERAAAHGFDDRDRLELEGAFERLRRHPRFRAVADGLSPR